MGRSGIEPSKGWGGYWDTVLLEREAPGTPEAIKHILNSFHELFSRMYALVSVRGQAQFKQRFVYNPTGAWPCTAPI
jgi:hypothetical protein